MNSSTTYVRVMTDTSQFWTFPEESIYEGIHSTAVLLSAAVPLCLKQQYRVRDFHRISYRVVNRTQHLVRNLDGRWEDLLLVHVARFFRIPPYRRT